MFKINSSDFRFWIFCIGIVTAVFFLPACRKNTECTATITVFDTTGKVISGASVRLYTGVAKSGYSNIEQSVVTDAGGQAVFVFKLQGIFDIDVTKGGVTKIKAGVVKLEPGKSVSKDVTFP